MRKIFISITLVFSIFTHQVAYAMDSKSTLVLTMAGYGVVGGALLGTASLAFGTSGRSVAKGASLGLYAGLIFGAYAVTSYELKKRGYGEPKKDDYYPESQGPYESSQNEFKNIQEIKLASEDMKIDSTKTPLFYMNLLNYQF